MGLISAQLTLSMDKNTDHRVNGLLRGNGTPPPGECPVTSVECCLLCLGDVCRHRFRCKVELFLVAEKHICCQVQDRRKVKGYNIQF